MDKIVLARLTGRLGDAQTIGRCCSDVAGLECHLLADMIREEMNLDLDIEYAGYRSGMASKLVEELGAGYTLASVNLRNWCSHFVVGVANGLPIAMIARFLGDPNPAAEAGTTRRLSSIEVDTASLLLNRIVSVLRSGIDVPGDFAPVLSQPYPAADHAQHAADAVDDFAVTIRLSATLGEMTGEIVLVIPQQVLLKTVIAKPGARAVSNADERNGQIADHILRSQVDLCARIKLTPLKLSSIARLRPGDVIPFEDVGEVHVDMDANRKTMYRCEFGRSGENYSVKVKGNSKPDIDTIQRILNA